MNDTRSWSFTDRSFLYAVAVSVLWHLFWFFSVTIVVTAPVKRTPVQPEIVSLGRVLDDTLFKTLVENRPEISRAFYRPPPDISTATEAPAQATERYSAGDVVSVPQGKQFTGLMKDLMTGSKASPDAGLPTLVEDAEKDYFDVPAKDPEAS